MLTSRFAASKLKLSSKEHVIEVLTNMLAATEKGELDDILLKVMNKRRRKGTQQ